MKQLIRKRQTDSYLFLGVILACSTTAYQMQSVWLALIAMYYVLMLVYKRQAFLLGLVAFASLMIAIRVYWQQPPSLVEGSFSGAIRVRPDTIKSNGDLITFEGEIPEGKIMVRLLVQSETDKEQWQRRQDWQVTITGEGKFIHPLPPRNKHAFDYVAYLNNHHFLGTIELTDLQNITPNTAILPLRKWRGAAISHVQQVFPSHISTYINALLFGFKDHEFQTLRDLYSGSGLLHFFTISGMHVSFFFKNIMYIFRRLHVTGNEMMLPILCLLGTSMVIFGGSISVLRAGLVFVLNEGLTSRAKDISASDRYGIVLTVLVMIEPNILLQVSGQLCLLMTFLLLMANRLKSRYHPLLSGLLLTLMAGPVLAHLFFESPVLGGVVTMLFYPLMTIVLLPGALLLYCMSLVAVLPQVIFFAEVCLKSLEIVLGHLGNCSLTIGALPLPFALFCSILGVVCYQKRHVIFLLVVTIILPFGYQKWQVEPTISFVDVGQGDSIVIQEKRNQAVYVIDTGGTLHFERASWQQRSSQPSAAYSLIPFLKGEGVNQITGLFLTHGDTDHIGDALFLMQSIPVETLYLVPGSQKDPRMAELLANTPETTNIVWTEVEQIIGEDVPLQVLSPAYGEGQNEDSLVLHTNLGPHTFLFTGDLDQSGELDLLAKYPDLAVDVLKLGHHGSRTSTAKAFIDHTSPRFSVASCGLNNRYGHPHPEVLDVLADSTVLRTDIHGMIQFSWSEKKQQLYLRTWLDAAEKEW